MTAAYVDELASMNGCICIDRARESPSFCVKRTLCVFPVVYQSMPECQVPACMMRLACIMINVAMPNGSKMDIVVRSASLLLVIFFATENFRRCHVLIDIEGKRVTFPVATPCRVFLCRPAVGRRFSYPVIAW